MSRTRTYVKALTAGAVLCIGGPALVMYVTPTEEEIFNRYSPELKERAIAMRDQREKEFDEYVTQLKEISKSKKNIWIAQKEFEEKRSEDRAQRMREQYDATQAEAERLKQQVRAAAEEEPAPKPAKTGWKAWIPGL